MTWQARALLVAAREAVKLMPDGGRIIATYAPGARTGSWQPWVAMGSAKQQWVALPLLCCRPGNPPDYGQCGKALGATDDSVFNTLPAEVPDDEEVGRERLGSSMRRLMLADFGTSSLCCAP